MQKQETSQEIKRMVEIQTQETHISLLVNSYNCCHCFQEINKIKNFIGELKIKDIIKWKF